MLGESGSVAKGAPSGRGRTAGRRRPLSLGLCCGVDRSLARSLNIDGAPARPQASRPWESERHLRLGEESSSRNGAPVPSLSHSRRPRRGAEWRTLKARVPGGTFPWPRGFSRPSPAPWAGPSLISLRRRKAGTPLPALMEAATGRCRCTAARGQVQGARSRGETRLGRRGQRMQERQVGGRGAPCSSPKALTHTGALCQSLGKTSSGLLPFPNLSSSRA